MRSGPLLVCLCAVVVGALLALPATGHAATITVLSADGTAREVRDPALPPPAWTGLGAAGTPARPARVRALAARRRTVPGELRRLLRAGAIDPIQHDDRRATYEDAKRTLRRLTGARRVALGAVLRTLEALAARGALTRERVEPLWLTLEANQRWWTRGPLLASGQRVGFEGSELVWQHYPGQGLQLQVLATFGRLNGFWTGGRRFLPRLETLVDEVVPLAVPRAGGVAWESYFAFGPSAPPWVSAMSQGTAAQALSRAAVRLGRQAELFPLALGALGVFRVPPPVGVRVPSAAGKGEHYLLYSGDPDLRVLNGFVQSLNGLFDVATLTGDVGARSLFDRGELAARAEVPAHDTGAWSLYSRGRVQRESDLGYHTLVRDFLTGLCTRTAVPVHCATRERFDLYLRQPPALAVRTRRLRGGRPGVLRLRLSKIARVTLRVRRGGRDLLVRGPELMGYGDRTVAWAVPRRRGRYEVLVRAVDLAGNASESVAGVQVTAPPRRRRG